MLDESAREALIDIVCASLKAAVVGETFTPVDPGMDALRVAGGCFVTYKTDGQLRGCIGCFTSEEPLYLTVSQYARASALEDPRFASQRLRPEELPQVHLDISVLSPLERTDEPANITLGTHGIYVKSDWRSGCFLPQVATETGWSVEQFWSNCCTHKAGLPAEAWKTGAAECFIFTAEVIESPYRQVK